MNAANLNLTLLNAIVFGLFGLIFWLFPGSQLLPNRAKLAKLDRLFLATTFGFALYAATIFLTRLAGFPFWLGLAPSLFLALRHARHLRGKMHLDLPKPTSAQKLFLAITLLGMLIQGLVLFRSGVITNQGIKFTELSFHDSVWHIYLINELKDNFPPRHAGFAPYSIKNYHFLLDITLASIAKYLPLSTFELYYRIVPAFVALLSSLGIFVLARRLTGSEKTANVALFLALFAGNASWFVQFFRGEEFQYGANTFMLDPYIDLLQNPHAVIVFPLLLAGVLALMVLEKDRNRRWISLSALAFGVLIGFKAWGGSLILGALPVAAAWESLKKKRHDLWLVWLMSLVLALLIFLPLYDPETAAGIIFIPGWLLKRMVEDPDRYNLPQYYFLEQHYRDTHSLFGLIRINFIQTAIYIFGNLWLRTLGLFVLLKLLVKKTSSTLIFLATVILASLSLPLLFNQGRMAYDIIQFAPYGLLLLAIFTAPMLVSLANKVPKQLRWPALFLLLTLAVPSNTPSIRSRALDKSFLISKAELEAYSFLKDQTEAKSIVLLYPSQRNVSTALVAALTQRPTYFSAETFVRISGEDYEGRRSELIKFFNSIDPRQRQKIIEATPINYLLLTQEQNQGFNPAGINLSKVFTNEQIIIYLVSG